MSLKKSNTGPAKKNSSGITTNPAAPKGKNLPSNIKKQSAPPKVVRINRKTT